MREELKKLHEENNVFKYDFVYIPSVKTDIMQVFKDKYGFLEPSKKLTEGGYREKV
jgi:hypothetical protein